MAPETPQTEASTSKVASEKGRSRLDTPPLRRVRSRSCDVAKPARGRAESFEEPKKEEPKKEETKGVKGRLRRKLDAGQQRIFQLEKLAVGRLKRLGGKMHLRRRKRGGEASFASPEEEAASPLHEGNDEDDDLYEDEAFEEGGGGLESMRLAEAVIESAYGIAAAVVVVVVAAVNLSVDAPVFVLVAAIASLAVQCDASRRAAYRLATASLATERTKGRLRKMARYEEAAGDEAATSPASPEARTLGPASPLRNAPTFPKLVRPLVAIARSEDGDGSAANGWSRPEGARFPLRGPSYLKDGVKAPSAAPIYDVAGAYVGLADGGAVESAAATHPEVLASLRSARGARAPERSAAAAKADALLAAGKIDAATHASALPPFLLVTVQTPLDAPSLKGWRPSDRRIVIVFACELAEAPEDSPARALAEYWFATAPENPAANGRLKGIFFADGATVPRLTQKWNGKPVLMAGNGKPRPGIATFHRGDDFLEVSIDVGEHFSYISRGAIYLLQDKLATMDATVGFTIEGRTDDELPEGILAAIAIHKLDWRALLDPKPGKPRAPK